MEQESERDHECCSRLFLAEVAQDEPGILLLECCLCGRAWRRERDGTLVPRIAEVSSQRSTIRARRRKTCVEGFPKRTP